MTNKSTHPDLAYSMLEAALKARDAVAFNDTLLMYRDEVKTALNENRFRFAAEMLTAINRGLDLIPSSLSYSGLSRVCNEFVEKVMWLFSVNGPEALKCMGLSREIDDYIIKNKVDFKNLTAASTVERVMSRCLSGGYQEEFETGIKAMVDDAYERSVGLANADKRLFEYQLLRSDCDVFIRNLEKTIDRVDEKVASPFTVSKDFDAHIGERIGLMDLENGINLEGKSIRVMIKIGMTETIKGLLNLTYGIKATEEDFDGYEGMDCNTATDILGGICRHHAAPGIVAKVVQFDSESVAAGMHIYSYKDSSCRPANLLRSVSLHMASDKYSADQDASLMALVENALLRLKKNIKSGDKDYVVYREAMNEAGIPNEFQFRIGKIRKNRDSLFSNEIGL